MKIMENLARLTMGLSLLIVIVFPVLARDYDEAMPAEPATLGNLQDNIRFPNFPEDITVLLFCSSRIYYTEFLGALQCYRDKDVEDQFKPDYTKNADRELDTDVVDMEVTGTRSVFLQNRYERAVVEAIKTSTFTAARVYGDKVSVIMNFSVLFRKRNGQEHITVFNHHFRNLESMGSGYTAAQRIYEFKDNRCLDGGSPVFAPIWMEGDVEVTGSVQNISLFEAGFDEDISRDTLEYCIKIHSTLINVSQFIPIIYRGQYVNGTYVELFYTQVGDMGGAYERDIMANYGGSGRTRSNDWTFKMGVMGGGGPML